jgi:hypothetical protein
MSNGQNNKKQDGQSANVYSYDKKKRLAKKISTLKRKKDMVKILEIISEDDTNITENQNGLFMFFHKLNDSTYHKIDLYLRSTTKKKTSENSDKNNFVSYAKNEFSDTKGKGKTISENNPKLKYSNREKNIIKRQRYSERLLSESNTESNVMYTKFDVNILSDSENAHTTANSGSDDTKHINNIEEITQSDNIETEESTKITIKKVIKPVKRKRGRPRKNVVV